jgi:hypothetical protein
MRNRLLWLPALLLAGCGGNGSNPPASPPIPAELRYPAYTYSSPDGDELFLQIADTGGAIQGRFAFIFEDEGQPTIFDGEVQGVVANDGTLMMTLHNPFDATEAPIALTGHRTGAGIEVADVEVPEVKYAFEPYAGPTGTRGVFDKIRFEVRLPHLEQALVHSMFPIAYWLLPPTYSTKAWTETDSTHFKEDDEDYAVELWSWGRGWTNISVKRPQDGRFGRLGVGFTGWVHVNPWELGINKGVKFSEAELYNLEKSSYQNPIFDPTTAYLN